VNKVSPTATAMHPAWRDALAFFDLPVFGANGSVPAAEKAVLVNTTAAVDALFAKLGYPIGGYYGEQSVQTAAWKDLNWGSNYARLSKIKTQVDPHGVFSCAYCVNSDVLGW
jgi:FAD/FMN-containing dehydrogenase